MALSTAHAAESAYLVAGRDTLSVIAQKFLGEPIYTKNGSLNRLLALNPQIKDAHSIYPGQVIRIVAADHQLAACNLPLEQRTPASEPPTVTEAEFQKLAPGTFRNSSAITLTAGFEYFRLDAHDLTSGSDAAILSRMSPSFGLAWRLAWAENWESKVFFKLRQETFLAAEDNAKTFANADGSSKGFGIGATRSWEKLGATTVSFEAQEKIFLRSPSNNVISFDRISVPAVGLRHEMPIVRASQAALGAGAEAKFYFASKGNGYSLDSGFSAQPFLYLGLERELYSLRANAFYELRRQNSSLATQREATTGLSINFSLKLP